MGAGSGLALKGVQWFIRGVQFCCAAVVLGIFSYFLATLSNHDLPIAASTKAVEGISGAAVLYTIAGLLLLCCVAGFMFTSLIAIILDVCFIGAFIYVAVANRNGASSCNGYLDTPFGRGEAGAIAEGRTGGFTTLPSFRTACRLQTACLAVSIIVIFFFIFSILMEIALVRHHRKEKRFGPGPTNNYTSGYGTKGTAAGTGFLSRFRRNKNAPVADDANALPEHTHPGQLDPSARQSYGTEYTANTAYGHDGRGASADYAKQETGYGYPSTPQAGSGYASVPQTRYTPSPQAGYQQQPTTGGTWHTQPNVNELPADYRYNDGVYDRAQ
ncbi:sugar transporter [Purpureocillium lavendulum]|uniref:Sugar transporter n=1 Tax=Purpureocillium lavendulum TaxID=1247861 RepID=A0AB34FH78_9HYPO|nr:sugar transporter [Purpureocillium lavendulum]